MADIKIPLTAVAAANAETCLVCFGLLFWTLMEVCPPQSPRGCLVGCVLGRDSRPWNQVSFGGGGVISLFVCLSCKILLPSLRLRVRSIHSHLSVPGICTALGSQYPLYLEDLPLSARWEALDMGPAIHQVQKLSWQAANWIELYRIFENNSNQQVHFKCRCLKANLY